jgi:hypothetical protein
MPSSITAAIAVLTTLFVNFAFFLRKGTQLRKKLCMPGIDKRPQLFSTRKYLTVIGLLHIALQSIASIHAVGNEDTLPIRGQ